METPSQVEKVEEAAARWLLRRDASDWSATDEAQLQAWLQQSPSHQVAYVRLRTAWNRVGRLNAVGKLFEAGRLPERGEIKRLPFFRTHADSVPSEGSSEAKRARAQGVRIATVAAAIVVVSLLATAARWWVSRGTMVETLVGGLTTVPMEDGSRVTVNTDSELRILFSSKERRIDLERGEAYFDVAKNAGRPFVVYVANKRVTAVGTAFSVRIDGDHLDVKVTQGRVRVEDSDGDAPRTLAQLDMGEVARLSGRALEDVVVQQQPVDALERSLGWRNGMIMLRGTPLPDAVAEFNRYNEIKLVVADASLSDIKVGGNFKPHNMEGFVRLLEQGFQVAAHNEDGRIVLTRAP